MEDKKPIELTDEALDAAAGGSGFGDHVKVLCENCKQKKVSVLRVGLDQVTCPKCGATLICIDGKVIMCIHKVESN